MFLTIVLFVFILGILIYVHELGHFIAAKISNIKVEEFAFGFPPKLWGKKWGETEYRINAIPIGGYVKMLGESESSSSSRSYSHKGPFARAMVSVSGVLMNFALAWLILTIGFSFGMTSLTSSPDSIPGEKIKVSIVAASVLENSPAKSAGIVPGDILIRASYNGQETTFNSTDDLSNFTRSHKGKEVDLIFSHNNEQKLTSITLSEEGGSPLGVEIIDNSSVKVKWYMAPIVAFREIIRVIEVYAIFLVIFFKQLFSQGEISKEVGGPVAIYMLTGMAAKAGTMVVVQLIAILSISLAIINILPFPALDGGRLLFIAMEKIFRRKVVRENVENIIHMVGFALIILFAIAVTYKDVMQFIIK
jgi:regulator of sigma E protease